MSRQALALAVVLVALRASPAGAEPLDVDLSRLGPPDPAVWIAIAGPGVLAPGQELALANDAKKRFAILSSEVALALSGPILAPASTTGHAGFDVAMEGGWQPVHSGDVGTSALGFEPAVWPTRSVSPGSLTTTGLHVRKALPFSVELGGRLTYLNRSSYFAAQGEAKWALNEGFDRIPDVALRVAYTRLFGQREWNLGATDVDLVVSKRWGVSAVTSFTPYAAARFTFVRASSDAIDFRSRATPGDPVEQYSGVAPFPTLRVGLYRTTLGVRVTASVVSMALEATLFGGKSYSGEATPTAGEYPDFSLDSSVAAALKLGWEF